MKLTEDFNPKTDKLFEEETDHIFLGLNPSSKKYSSGPFTGSRFDKRISRLIVKGRITNIFPDIFTPRSNEVKVEDISKYKERISKMIEKYHYQYIYVFGNVAYDYLNSMDLGIPIYKLMHFSNRFIDDDEYVKQVKKQLKVKDR